MLLTALTATVEAAFNRYLALDDEALPRLQALQGKLIKLHITGLDIHLFFIPTSEHIKVATEYDQTPDVTIRGSALALARLSQAQDSGKAALANKIEIDGDMALGNRFSAILREVDIDWEEQLSHVVGDIVAHYMGQLGRDTQGWLTESHQAMQANVSEYVQEEARLSPAQTEVTQYLDEVDALRADTDRLKARIQRLQSQSN